MHAVIYIYLLNGGNFHRKLFKLIYIFISIFEFITCAKEGQNNVWKETHSQNIHKQSKMIISIMKKALFDLTAISGWSFMVKYIHCRIVVNFVYFYGTIWKMMNMKRLYCSLIQINCEKSSIEAEVYLLKATISRNRFNNHLLYFDSSLT